MIKLTCSSCGGKLEITDDIERFACGSCGTEWIVNRSGGIVSLKAAEESLKKIEKSSEGTEKHTEILVVEAKLKTIREKIAALEQIKSSIDGNPQIPNADCKRLFRLKDTKAAIGTVLLIISIAVGAFILRDLVSCFMASEPIGLLLGSLFIDLIGPFAIGLFLLVNASEIKIPAKYITDECQKEINIKKLFEINQELREFQQKAQELEASLLK